MRRLARAAVPGGLAIATLLFAVPAANAVGGVKATIKKGVLTVTGTNAADTITIRLRPGDANTLEVDVGGDGSAEFAFARQKFTGVIVNGASGDDLLVADPSDGLYTDTELTTLDGGGGNDTILGAHGPETLVGGTGDDRLTGRRGIDTLDGGDGGDVFQWDPGDASDTIAGGGGTDQLFFFGSNAGELFDVSAVGDHVRFTRNIGTVVTDLTEVEVLDIRALSGIDVANVHDLTGTALTEVRTDLAGFGGVDDAAADSIVVPPGLAVGQDGPVAVVNGLGAQVRVINGGLGDRIQVTGTTGDEIVSVVGSAGADVVSVTTDGTEAVVNGATPGVSLNVANIALLDIDLGAGDDTFTSTGDVASLVNLDVDGGEGNDTLRGSNGADHLNGGVGADFLDGNQGIDTLDGGDDADVFQWDPGDASDTIAGGGGTDQFFFFGSNAGETFDVSAIGDQVRLTRNVGTVVTDFTGVEVLDIRALGGIDIATVHDLTGTALTEVRTDLAATGGVDDAAADSIVVPPGLTVGQDGPVAVVNGLGAQVRVINGGLGDRIQVTGTTGDEIVSVVGSAGADVVSVTTDGTEAAVFGATPGVSLNVANIGLLDIDLGVGDDTFTSTGDVASLVNLDVDGGEGNDTLRGSNGADVLNGGVGADFLDGNQGIDTLDGGDDADVFQWDPGDASDTITGGGGTDQLFFFGSAIGELFDVSAVGDHVRFTRNIGTVVTDLTEVEVLDIRALGGADIANVHDLTGTALTEVRTDLAAPGGVDDAAADSIAVDGTAGDDAIDVADEGSAVVVRGLAATVRVTGAGPTTDVLTVNGLEGDDAITATPGASALILLNLLQ